MRLKSRPMTSPRYPDGILLELVGLLYDAAGDVDKWQTFVDACMQVFHSTTAHLFSYNPDARRIHLNFNLFCGATADAVQTYVDFWVSRAEIPMDKLDLRLALALQHRGRAITCSMLPNRDALEGSELYQAILHPHGLDFILAIHIPHEPPCYSAFGVMRDLKLGPYDAEDVAAFDKLAPHFNRAIHLQQQLLEIDLQKRTALDALNLLPIGIVLVDAHAHVLFANQAAEQLSQEEGGISLQGDWVWSADPKQTVEIREKIRLAVVCAEQGRLLPGCSIALQRPPPHRPLSLTISPLWGNHLKTRLGFLQRPYCILFLSDPDSVQETHTELFQRLYGLTATEAVVLKHLCEGSKPQQIADMLGVLVKTVRAHLSSLYTKTATTRQS
ncbi:MAG: helix-turn-helix transcriptional regulator, partial [Methylococcaceae bacterium]